MSPSLQLTPETILILTAIFLVAGIVKGTAGLGLPSVSVGLLTATVGLMPAMALIIVPAFVANVWQAVSGPELPSVTRRIWRFEIAALVGIPIGGLALIRVDVDLLSALLGLLLTAHALNGLLRPPVSLPTRHEAWAGPLAGIWTGIFAAMTGSYSVPAVIYFQSLGFNREQLIQAMGLHFALCAAVLGLVLGANRLMPGELLAISAACVVPALAGMEIGRRLRRRLSEEKFRTVFNCALLSLGAFLAVRWLTG